MCRVFSTTLKGSTLRWFTRLTPLSIDFSDSLVEKFGTQFATSRPHHLTSIALVNIRQEKGESLKIFMEHFEKVVLNIQNLSNRHYATTLRPILFTNNL